jgi:phage gp36-like protein
MTLNNKYCFLAACVWYAKRYRQIVEALIRVSERIEHVYKQVLEFLRMCCQGKGQLGLAQLTLNILP